LKNTYQVYGLPRSGTNFIEWSIRENIKAVNYKTIISQTEIPEIPTSRVSEKHNYPTFKYSDKIVIIYKDWDKFIISFEKWAKTQKLYNKKPKFSKKSYDEYLKKCFDLKTKHPEKVIIFNHDFVVENYNESIKKIADFLGKEVKENIKFPKFKLNMLGANCKQTNELYFHNKGE